jgi:hypothetical protein
VAVVLLESPVAFSLGPIWAVKAAMPSSSPKPEPFVAKPICLGLSCWRWQRRGAVIVKLARGLGVQLQLTERVSGLRREIDCRISGENADRFIGEFIRRC